MTGEYIMKFNDGAEVFDADGKTLGELGRVVLNPHTWEVTDIVVHKGFFFTTDKVIPVGDIQQTLEDRVTLLESAKVDTYPDYAETDFVSVVGDHNIVFELLSPVPWYPPFGMMNFNPYTAHETKNSCPEKNWFRPTGSRRSMAARSILRSAKR
jgi:sporulation protein YlmC with PRC-barrel domain